MLPDILPRPDSANINEFYDKFCKHLLGIASQFVPRGFRKDYVPCWDKTCSDLARQHEESSSWTETQITASALLEHLDKKRQARWMETVEAIDMKHSSRKAWSTVR